MKTKLGDICHKETSGYAQKDLENLNGEYPIYGASGYIKCIDSYHQENPYVAVVKDGAGVGRTMYLPGKSSVIGTLQYLIPEENIDAHFLYYLVKAKHLEKYYMGAAIPHIYFRDYKNENIPDYDLKKQLQIVSVLSRIEKIIDYKKQQIEQLDNLIKARFVEMFGNPVLNDKGWEQKSLGEITTKIGSGATPKGGKEVYQEEGITLIRSMNVHNSQFEYKDLVYISDEQAVKLDSVTIEKNDVLLNITGASVARSCVVPSKVLPARVNQHVCIIRCKECVIPEFLNKLLIDDNYQDLLWSVASGGATREAITKQQVENLQIILPTIELQKEFMKFCQQIDKSKFGIRDESEKEKFTF